MQNTNTSNGEMTAAQRELDAKVREKLVTARIALLLKAPFFGNLATRLDMVRADDWLPTAATDGRRFYYNTEFVNKLSQNETAFLFGHEVLHNVFDHLGRRSDRDPKIWNIANDFVVNQVLVDEKIGEKITTVPICLDNKYRDWTSEQVYDDLMKNAVKIKINMNTLDEHIDFGDDGNGDSDGDKDGQDGDKDGKGRPKLSKEEMKQIRDEIKEAVIAAAKTAGNVPNCIKRMIQELTEPKMNWRELLRMVIESTIKSDFVWTRPNRKTQNMGIVLPSMTTDLTIELCVSIDTSGSISNEMVKDFLSEVKGIMDQFSEYNIKIWTFDTQVYNPQDYNSADGDDITEYQPEGGGGTDFEVNWAFMKQEDITPKMFIMFTDGYPCGGWGDENYADTIFVIHGNDSIIAPFGTTIHYEKGIAN